MVHLEVQAENSLEICNISTIWKEDRQQEVWWKTWSCDLDGRIAKTRRLNLSVNFFVNKISLLSHLLTLFPSSLFFPEILRIDEETQGFFCSLFLKKTVLKKMCNLRLKINWQPNLALKRERFFSCQLRGNVLHRDISRFQSVLCVLAT